MLMRLQRYGFMLIAFYAVFGFALLGDWLQPARYFGQIFLTVLLVGWLLNRLRLGKGLPTSSLNAPIIALLTLTFIAGFFSHNPRLVFERLWISIFSFGVYLFIVNSFQHGKHKLVMEVFFLVVTTLFMFSFVSLLSIFFGFGLLGLSSQGWIDFIGTGISFPLSQLRVGIPIGLSTTLGSLAGLAMIIGITWATSVSNTAYRIILWIFVTLVTIILLATQSRAAFISVAIGLVLLFILNRMPSLSLSHIFNRKNLPIIVVGMVIVGVVISVVLGISLERRSGDSVRLDLWRSAVLMFVDNPVTGVGEGQYGRTHPQYGTYENARTFLHTPDNLYLLYLAQNGVFAILIGGWGAWVIWQSWHQLRQQTTVKSARWYRLNGMMVALIVFFINRIFATIIGLEVVLFFIVMLVYCTVERTDAEPQSAPLITKGLAVSYVSLLLVYGIWFMTIVHPAYGRLVRSANPANDQLAEAQRACDLDPNMTLCTLYIAYLEGLDALENPTPDSLNNAIELHLRALEIEPSWVNGKVNLAALYEANDNPEQALMWLADVHQSRPDSPAHLHWSRIAEANDLATDDQIVTNYVSSIQIADFLPFSNFWLETPLREQALQTYSEQLPLDRQYRVYQVHYPERLSDLVPENPQSAIEWWVVGQHALTVNNDASSAIDAFSTAINLNPNVGDYYASRARAHTDPDLALRDLEIATFLGTNDEYPAIIQLDYLNEEDDLNSARASAVPPYTESFSFEFVVYDVRIGLALRYLPIRQIGPGDPVMQVWYDLAADYEAAGAIDDAIRVYTAISLRSPEDDRPQSAIDRLLDR